MKLNIQKISSILFLAFMLIFQSCEDESMIEIVSPKAKFELQSPAISSVYLNFGLPDNPALTMTWVDDTTTSGDYTLQMSLDESFKSVADLGTSKSKQFTISVKDLNSAINKAGATGFKDISIYVRVKNGSTLSNTVLYFVTTYPTNPPVLTKPSANDAIVLEIAKSTDIALTTTWTDALLNSNLGVDVTYTVEAAIAGSNFASPVILGTVKNLGKSTITHGDLNAAALGLGIAPTVAGNVDVRVVAKNTNKNGNVLTRTSTSTKIAITPYSVSFPNLFMVGDATSPGWNNNNTNTPLFRDQNVPNKYVYTGYFKAGAFKLLEVLGQWQPQWGTNDGATLAVNPGGGNDPNTFNIAADGYYSFVFTTVGQSGTYTVSSYNATSAPTYSTMGIIGAAIGGWGDSDEVNFTKDANNPHLWYALNVSFTKGSEFLIRANDGWNSVWRYDKSDKLYGKSYLAGGGDNFPFKANSGKYDVWFNDLTGDYNIIPK